MAVKGEDIEAKDDDESEEVCRQVDEVEEVEEVQEMGWVTRLFLWRGGVRGGVGTGIVNKGCPCVC